MPGSLAEMAEFLLDLLDVVASWRLYVCLGAALAFAWLIGEKVASPVLSWGLAIPIVLAGLLTGWKWDRRRG